MVPVPQSVNKGQSRNDILVMLYVCKARLLQHSVHSHERAATEQEVQQLPTSRCLPEQSLFVRGFLWSMEEILECMPSVC